jgi:uncharacterized protein
VPMNSYAYRTPGVYFEWSDNPPPGIGLRRTDVAGFVGIAARGPLRQAVKVTSENQFTTVFGPPIAQGYLAYAVNGFFENGGRTCWVVRVADPALAECAALDLPDGRVPLPGDGPLPSPLRLVAVSPGVWGRGVDVAVLPAGAARFTLILRGRDGAQEIWRDLSLDEDDARAVVRVLNDDQSGSVFVRAEVRPAPAGVRLPAEPARPARFSGRLTGGQDGLAPSVTLPDQAGNAALRLIAATPGAFGVAPIATVSDVAGDRFSLTLRWPDGRIETWPGLSTRRPFEAAGRRSRSADAEATLNREVVGSRLVIARDLLPPPRSPAEEQNQRPRRLVEGDFAFAGGLSPGLIGGWEERAGQRHGLALLETVDEVSIVAIPDIMPKPFLLPGEPAPPPFRCDVLDAEPPPPSPRDTPREFAPAFGDGAIDELQRALIAHCARMQDRVAVLDPPGPETTVPQMREWRRGVSSRYAAVYYPWLGVPDPLRLSGLLRQVPPSGHVAGVYAREDRRVGVHKPPANAALAAAHDLSRAIDDAVHGDLNERGINVIRPYPGRGLRVAGARTLADPRTEAEWRYVNVRRLLIAIEEAIAEDLAWTTFEPNNQDLWREVDRLVRAFLDQLWRRGVLDGATAEEAYFVRCDESTNPPPDIDAGRLTCEVGVRPPWPAEFVVVRIGRTQGGVTIDEEMGARNG